MRISAKELAILLEAQIDGNPDAIVDKLVKIEEADANSLCFIANPKYAHFAATTHAGILVVSKDFDIVNNNGTTYLRVQDPYSSFAVLLDKFAQHQAPQLQGIEQPSFIDETAQIAEDFYLGAFSYIGKNVRIAKGVKIYPNCYVGDYSVIAQNTVLHPGVVVYHHTQIGANCIIHAGAILGSDGFGFALQKDGSFSKVPQTGNVIIGSDVEIGANTVIDRATLGSTIVEDGVKLDNLVQIAHNVSIGKHSVVAAQAGISGSSKLGKHVMVGGQAGLVGHIQIADGVKINAQSGVSKSISANNSFVSGSPAEPFRQHYKNLANIRNMAELLERIEKLERELLKKSE